MTLGNDHIGHDSRVAASRILVVGVGGGGSRILTNARADWPDPPTMAAVNTDARALAESNIPLRVTLGRNVAKGMGAGGDLEIGRLAANEDLDALRALVANRDLLILIAGLGGGTGSGVAPILARIAREEGLLVLAYVTTPFTFEGSRRQEQAQECLAALKQTADAVICLPNERLHDLLPEGTPLQDAFAFVDRMMTAGVRGLWTLLTRNNTLNLDFSDLQSLVENSGNECSFGYGEGQGPDKAEQALRGLLQGPMLQKGRALANSGAMILNVIGGPDLSLSEIDLIHSRFEEAARPGARIVMGAAVFDEWHGQLALTALVAEHWMPPARKTGGLTFPSETTPSEAEPRPRRRRNAARQPELALAPGRRDRFQGVAPTIHEGADLDIPTYIRLGARIPS